METFLELFTPELLWRFGLGVLALIVSFVLPVLANQARRYFLLLREKVEAELGIERFNLVWNWAETMIRAAEQHTGLDTNAKKKAFVVEAVYNFANKQGWPLTHEQVDNLVEGVFNAVKPSLKGLVSKTFQFGDVAIKEDYSGRG